MLMLMWRKERLIVPLSHCTAKDVFSTGQGRSSPVTLNMSGARSACFCVFKTSRIWVCWKIGYPKNPKVYWTWRCDTILIYIYYYIIYIHICTYCGIAIVKHFWTNPWLQHGLSAPKAALFQRDSTVDSLDTSTVSSSRQLQDFHDIWSQLRELQLWSCRIHRYPSISIVHVEAIATSNPWYVRQHCCFDRLVRS